MGCELNWELALGVIEPQITNQGLHVWPFNPAFPVDVRFFLLNREHDIPPVRPDHLEVIYIESGEVVYESRERECLLQKGDVVVAGNRACHRCRKSAGASPKRAAVLLFQPELILDSVSKAESRKFLMPFKLGEGVSPKLLTGATGASLRIFDLIQQISAELQRASQCSRLVIKNYLKMILGLLADQSLNAQPKPQDRPPVPGECLDAVIRLVERRYPSSLTVGEAAGIAGLSRWRFMRLFKRVMGQSFVNYLHHFRIGKAQELLVRTEKSIADVSQETGFCDQSYFGLVFRRYAHLTPLGYRRTFGAGSRSASSN